MEIIINIVFIKNNENKFRYRRYRRHKREIISKRIRHVKKITRPQF